MDVKVCYEIVVVHEAVSVFVHLIVLAVTLPLEYHLGLCPFLLVLVGFLLPDSPAYLLRLYHRDFNYTYIK